MGRTLNSKYFKPEEFACKCGCGFMSINEELVFILGIIREVLAKPLIIRSGCRCKKWNEHEGGKKNSDHLTGNGVDVKAIDSRTRFLIIDQALLSGINRIGVASNFVHLGMNPANPQRVFWLYI